MKVWIDLANSPHPLLFEPIAKRLERRGATVAVTVRDHAQTRELALERWPDATVIGAASPSGRLAKPRAIAARAAALADWARAQRPEVALSHNSYAQILAARVRRIRAVTAMDYEHQPANHLAFRAAHQVLLPEALPEDVVRRQGASARKAVRYAGLKEEVYLAEFEPDPDIDARLGLRRQGLRLAVARAAPAGAAYHRAENPLLERTLRYLSERGEHLTVVLARHPEQGRTIAGLGLPRIVIPEAAIDARSLLWQADLFVGAGGTMTREAALLGIPTCSIFAGRPAAVDLLLERRGLLTQMRDPSGLAAIERDPNPRPKRLEELRLRGAAIAELFVLTALGREGRPAALASSVASGDR
jgi:predicted glycosyltransferase